MIARVVYPRGLAVLTDAGRWACADPDVEGVLNTLVLGADLSPAAGAPYYEHVGAVARMLRGEAEYEDRGDPGAAGRVY